MCSLWALSHSLSLPLSLSRVLSLSLFLSSAGPGPRTPDLQNQACLFPITAEPILSFAMPWGRAQIKITSDR